MTRYIIAINLKNEENKLFYFKSIKDRENFIDDINKFFKNVDYATTEDEE